MSEFLGLRGRGCDLNISLYVWIPIEDCSQIFKLNALNRAIGKFRMGFIDESVVDLVASFGGAHFPFSRGNDLKEALSWCATDYYGKAMSGQAFEARGVLVIGKTRQGKTREITKLCEQFNDDNIIMPDGRPAQILNCFLSGKITWKDLGARILKQLNYGVSGRRTQAEIWDLVTEIAQLQGVVGIHFDECQHVFTKNGAQTNQQILDSFKTLLKDPRWPLMLILSGVPSLADHVAEEEQLSRLLRTVSFDDIDLGREQDRNELLHLTYSYAERAGLNFEPLANMDFLERLAFACANRWGLVIETLIEAFLHCRRAGERNCSIDHFSLAYAKIYGTPIGCSPFEMPDYAKYFDQEKLVEALKKTK